MIHSAQVELGRELWKLIMSRPATREAHAAYVGTDAFLMMDDELEKVRAQVRAIEEGTTLTADEQSIATQIKASIDALSQSRLPSAASHATASQ